MPILDASFLDSDSDGAEFLRGVLDTGRRSRRRKITDLLGMRDLRPAEAVVRPITVEIGQPDDEPIHAGVLAAAAT
jgi:hypothetical protein